MQLTHLGRDVSYYEVWEIMKMKAPDLTQPQPQLPEFYGSAEEDGARYLSTFQGLNPEVDDPRSEETDPRALVVASGGFKHGRLKVLDKVTPRTSDLTLTRVKATLTADDPPIPPRRRSSHTDVSSTPFHHLSDIRSLLAKLMDSNFLKL